MTHARSLTAFTVLLLCTSAWAQGARDHIHVVGSSTVYPFVTVVAERFGRSTNYRTPKIESTGTGSGFRLFCGGIGVDYPDIVTTSRQIKPTEADTCRENGVSDVVQVKIGYDGIVLAKAGTLSPFDLSVREVFLALARDVPGKDDATLRPNPHRLWSDIHPRLPGWPIKVYGPPPTSGTRDELVEQALERGCHTFDWLAALHDDDPVSHREICQSVREDGAYVDAGENDNFVVQRLLSDENAFGIFGFSFLDQNADSLSAVSIDGIYPSYEKISEGSYPITRALYLYIKTPHVGVIAGLDRFVEEIISERAVGEEGYLADRGLVTMSANERVSEVSRVRGMISARLVRN